MRQRQGALTLDVAFALTRPWTVLFGPSGSGKSTVLRGIAGVLRPERLRLVRDGSVVLADTERGIFLPAHGRGVRWAAQVPALFPHMSVRENLRFAGADEGAVTEGLERFRLTAFAEKMPMALSGGERQRVSIARAAVAGGEVLLLDEPFSGLEAVLRDELLRDLQAWLGERGTTVLSVTHDVGEAFQLGAEVIKLAEGRVVEQGPVEEVLAGERRRLLEQLAGGVYMPS